MHADTLSGADQRPDGLARVEDRRLLTGRGQYVHDLQVPGMLHAVFVRSTYACARLRSLDLQAACAGADVLAVIDAAQLGALTMPPANPLLPLQPLPEFPLLARSRVDFLGQPIALVVARSLYAAQHAAELLAEGLEPWAVSEMWVMGIPVNPAEELHVEDVTDNVERKIRALLHHKTQHQDPVGTEQRVRGFVLAAGKRYGLAEGRSAEVFRVVDTR